MHFVHASQARLVNTPAKKQGVNMPSASDSNFPRLCSSSQGTVKGEKCVSATFDCLRKALHCNTGRVLRYKQSVSRGICDQRCVRQCV